MKPIIIDKLIRSRKTKYETGLTDKMAIRLDNVTYMIKPATENYIHEGFQFTSESEYLGSHIFQMLGIAAHDTLLATYEGRPAVLCKDFATGLSENLSLYEFGTIAKEFSIKEGLSSLHLNQEKTPLLRVLQILNQADALNGIHSEAVERFWQTYVIDTFMALR